MSAVTTPATVKIEVTLNDFRNTFLLKTNGDLTDPSTNLSIHYYIDTTENTSKYSICTNVPDTPMTSIQATTLAGLLNRIKIPAGSNAENARQVLLSSIETLLAAINTYTQHQNNLQTVAALESKASILDNLQNLIDYVNLIQTSPFPPATITIVAAQIKPEYVRYIELYGKPLNGAFDPSLLADILSQLSL